MIGPAARGGRGLPRIADAVAAVAGDAPQRAAVFPVAVIALLMAVKVSSAASTGRAGVVLFTVALFVLPMVYALPGSKRVLTRHRWPVLAVQAVLTWVPFAAFGGQWIVGLGGLLAGLVLLMLTGPVSWLLAGAMLAPTSRCVLA